MMKYSWRPMPTLQSYHSAALLPQGTSTTFTTARSISVP